MTDATPAPTTVELTIDGQSIQVPKGTLVIRAAELLGITIPRFCDHPLLDPVGACRQCMVDVEGQRKPFTACTTTCTDAMVVHTHLDSQVAADAQRAQMEFLLINHPLDCPQCDKGGECPLQDQALAHGPPDSRMVDRKRRFAKPVPISSQIALDRERCVLCARCTRFSQQIAGEPFIELFERGALEQVAIYEDEPYESVFSGNVVQICPVGALTANSYRFKARPFDLRSVDGVCNQCSAGCNLRVDVRRGEIARQLARDNMAVNESWNCDKGRFGFEYVAHDDRLRVPLVRDPDGELAAASWNTALRGAATRLQTVANQHGPAAIGVLTGGRLTDEDAYALSRFTRDVLGTDNLDFRSAPQGKEETQVLGSIAGRVGPTYADVEAAPTVIIAGLDPQEEVPILFLRLRKAWRKKRMRIVVVGPAQTSLEGLAWRWVKTPAGGEAAALQSITAVLDGDPSGNDDFDAVAEALGQAGAQAVVLAGERLAQSPRALPAAQALAQAIGGHFAWVPRRNNARGAVDAGLLPGLLPGGWELDDPGPVAAAWQRLPATAGMDATAMLTAAADGKLRALYLVGVDPIRDAEDPHLAARALQQVDTLIVQDLLATASVRYADIVLPAQAPPERVGSFTTWEGRRQPFPQALKPQGLGLADWDIMRQLARALGTDLGWESAADVRTEAAPLMESAKEHQLAAAFAARPDGGPARPTSLSGPEVEPGVSDRIASAAPSPAPATAVTLGANAANTDEFPLTAVVVPALIGEASMLIGAKGLKGAARVPHAQINEADARRLGLRAGAHVSVIGPAGPVEPPMVVPLAVSAAVAPGCVVLPTHLGQRSIGLLRGGGGHLRVRLEAVTPDSAGQES